MSKLSQPFVFKLINLFTSDDNTSYLLKMAIKKYTNTQTVMYIKENIDDLVTSYSSLINREFSSSSPLPGITLNDYVLMYNRKFLENLDSLFEQTEPLVSSISDGHVASRANYANSTPNDLLEGWKTNPRSVFSMREDRIGDDDKINGHGKATIEYYDYSKMHQNQHTDKFGGAYFDILNKGPLRRPEGRTFGTDEEILSRRIFKSENGVENGFAQARISMHRRPTQIFKDKFDGAGVEMESQSKKHDMRSILETTERRGAARRSRAHVNE